MTKFRFLEYSAKQNLIIYVNLCLRNRISRFLVLITKAISDWEMKLGIELHKSPRTEKKGRVKHCGQTMIEGVL